MLLCPDDDAWGPGSTCRSLDFTILFQQSILLILPNAVFLALAIFTIFTSLFLRRRHSPSPSTRTSFLYRVKILLSAATSAAAIASLVTVAPPQLGYPRSTILVSRVLTLLSAILTIPVIDCLHARVDGVPHRPRTRLIASYLFQLLGHATFLRTSRMVGLAKADFAVEIILATLLGMSLMVESTGTLVLRSKLMSTTTFNPEDRWGIIGTTSVAWMYPLLISGIQRPLTWGSLYPLQAHLDAMSTNEKLTSQLEVTKPPGVSPSTTATLMPALRFIGTFIRAFPLVCIAPIIPRTIFLVAELLQPLAIQRLVEFVSEDGAVDISRPWALVGGVSLLYFVLATSNALFDYHVTRTVLSFRAAAVSTIFQFMIEEEGYSSKATSSTDSPATLMSVDIERVVEALSIIHDLWAAFPTIAVGCWLLYQRIGLAVFPCIGTIFIVLLTTSMLATPLASRQKLWTESTSERVEFTSSFLSHLKSITLSCYQPYFLRHSSTLRGKEVRSIGKYYRRLGLVATTAISAIYLTMVVTFASAWALARGGATGELTTAKIFSALSIIQIIGGPLQVIGQMAPVVFGATSSFARIGQYLDRGIAHRRVREKVPPVSGSALVLCNSIDQRLAKDGSAPPRLLHLVGGGATGKTTALRSVLHHYLLSREDVSVGYTAQQTALFENASIRDNITFAMSGKKSEPLEDQVQDARLAACITFSCLDQDIKELETGIETPVSILSGGQRQRVALARALYSRAPLLVLDDVVSAQDAITAAEILWNLYRSPSFLLTGRTILYASHTINRYDTAEDTLLACRSDGQVLTIEELSASHFNLQSRAKAVTKRQELKERTEEISQAKAAIAAADESRHSSRLGFSPYRFYFKMSAPIYMFIFFTFCAMTVGCEIGVPLVLQAWASQGPDGSLPRPAFYISMMALLAVGTMVTIGIAIHVFVALSLPLTSHRIHNRCMTAALATTKNVGLSVHQLVNRFTQDLFVVDYEFAFSLINTYANVLHIVAVIATIIAAVPLFGAVIPAVGAAVYMVQLLYLRSSRQVRSMELESKTSLFALFSDVALVKDTIQSLRITPDFSKRCHQILDYTQQPFYARLSMLRFLRVSLYVLTWMVTTIVACLAVRLRTSLSPALLGLALSNITTLSGGLKNAVESYTTLETSAVAVERLRLLAEQAQDWTDDDRKASVESSYEAADMQPLIDSGRAETVLEYKDVTMKYNPSSPEILHGISFAVPRGSRTAIVGRSGSGKSSLMTTMLRGLPDELCGGGRTLYGSDANQMSLEAWRRRFSYVPQEPVTWKGTIRSLLTVSDDREAGAIHSDADLWSALDAVGLGDRVRSAGKGLEALYGGVKKNGEEGKQDEDVVIVGSGGGGGDAGTSSEAGMVADASVASSSESGMTTEKDSTTAFVYFSRGETQLLAFARVLLERERPVLLLDEATSSLDAEAEKVVIDLVAGHPLLSERTVIAISHRIAFVANFDQVVVLESGRVKERGDPKLLSRQMGSAFGELARLQSISEEEEEESTL